MEKYVRLASLGLALSCTLLCVSCHSTSSGSSASSGGGYVLCMTDPSLPTVRLSAAFPVKTQDPSQPWATEFRRYIGQSGNEGSVEVTCQAVDSKDTALKEMSDTLKGQGKQVVETGWTYAQ